MSSSSASIGEDGRPLPSVAHALLQAEAATHLCALTTDTLAEEAVKHAEQQRKGEEEEQRERELQEEPEVIDMPIELEVLDAASLSAEVGRLCTLLSSGLSSTPWTIRVCSLKRVSSLAKSHAFAHIRALSSFPAEMARLRDAITEQLTDRRSQVVKQACATISAISAHFKAAYLADPPADSSAAVLAEYAAARQVWLDLTLHFLDALLPLIPITVQVINASACLCLSAIVKNIAGLYSPSIEGSPLVTHLIERGTASKHGIVRDHCYRAIANTIMRIDRRYLDKESELDREENARIEAAANAPAADAAAAAPAPAPAASSSSSSACSPLFSKLETVISVGIHDSFDKTRAAARLCLIHLEFVSAPRAGRLTRAMTAAQLKVFQKQRDDFLTNRSLGAVEAALTKVSVSGSGAGTPRPVNQIADEPSHNPSDEELEAELNPPVVGGKKKKAKGSLDLSSGIASSGSAADAKGSSKLKNLRKAFAKKKSMDAASSDDFAMDEAAPAHKKPNAKEAEAEKEREAAKVLAAAAAAAGEDEEADTESTPIAAAGAGAKSKAKGKKAKRAAAAAANDDDEEDEDDAANLKALNASSNKPLSVSADAASTTVALVSPPVVSTQSSRNFNLLSKLLDLENPMLTEKMIDFLLHDGVIEVFIAFIARVDPTDNNGPSIASPERMSSIKSFAELGAKYHNLMPTAQEAAAAAAAKEEAADPIPAESDIPLTHRSRPDLADTAEQTATRRSYHVMQILCGQRQSQSLMAVLTSKIPTIVFKLMCVFHPRSQGNFFHACAVLTKLVGLFPGTVLTAICSASGRTLLSLMFDHLHEPAVIPCLFALLTASVENKTMGSPLPSDLVHHIINLRLLHTKIVARIADPQAHQFRLMSQASADCLSLLFDKLASLTVPKHSSSLARLLCDDIGSMVSTLVSALVEEPNARPSWQQSNIALILHSLLEATADSQLTVTDSDPQSQAMAAMMNGGSPASLQKEIPNPLYPLKQRVNAKIGAQIELICAALTRQPAPAAGAESVAAAAPPGGLAADVAAASAPTAAAPAASPSCSLHPPLTFSSYKLTQSFTSRRVQLLRIIVSLISNDCASALEEAETLTYLSKDAQGNTYMNGSSPALLLSGPRLFNRIPVSSWSVLIDWFFVYSHNNFFHGNLKALLVSILKYAVCTGKAREKEMQDAAKNAGTKQDDTTPAASPSSSVSSAATTPAAAASSSSSSSGGVCLSAPSSCDDLFKLLFFDLKLLNRLVSFFTSSATVDASCTRSYTIEIGSHLRFSSELMGHHSWLWTYLQSSQQWHTFLPLLKAECLAQSRNLHVAPFAPPPAQSQRAQLERALGFSLGGEPTPPVNPDAFIIPPGYGEGIELGSVYAYHLGYMEKAAPPSAKKKRKKKKAKKNKKSGTGAGAGAAAASDKSNAGSDDEDDGGDDDAADSSFGSNTSSSSSAAPSPASSPSKPAALRVSSGDVGGSSPAPSPSSGFGEPMPSPSPPVSPAVIGGADTKTT